MVSLNWYLESSPCLLTAVSIQGNSRYSFFTKVVHSHAANEGLTMHSEGSYELCHPRCRFSRRGLGVYSEYLCGMTVQLNISIQTFPIAHVLIFRLPS